MTSLLMDNLGVSELTDQQAREDALDISRSVLVQAPAGSGKTELLAMRFLKLLSVVEEPEQVLAITFTKAATAEIRHRIIGKLEKARRFQESNAPAAEATTDLEIAMAAYKNSIRRSWRLLEQPHRLDIQTIDSLGLRIAHQMPLSGMPGSMLQPTEAASPLYRRAAQKTLDRLGGEDQELNAALRGLLLLRDSNLAECETLLAKLLSARDQWLRAFPFEGKADMVAVRQGLEEPFRREISRVLGRMHALLSSHPALTQELLRLAHFACSNSEELTIEISLLAGLTGLPSPSPDFFEHWQCFGEFLLTNDDKPRRGYNVNLGFPPRCFEKNEINKLVLELSAVPEFLDLLIEIRYLPAPAYTDEQWKTLSHILIVLRRAITELRTVFVEQGAVDFVEIGMAALDVLRDDTQGTGIDHLLVDEFQDTSRSQHQLISALLRKWDANLAQDRRPMLFDVPRTVFLVGDPMQSIYMFRHTDVELFAQVRDRGLETGTSHIFPKPLDLKTNFRSHAGLVEPLNKMFRTIFPYGVKHGSADVAFLPATPKCNEGPVGALQIHPDLMEFDKEGRDAARYRETKEILEIIRRHKPRIDEARERGEDFTVAILARAKNHLVHLAAALRDEGTPFHAVDLEQLGERQEVLDLQSLTRALLHPMDRIAWLAMLRAPWCGLRLRDLHILCGTDVRPFDGRAVSAQINDRLHLLDQDSKERVSRMLAIVRSALSSRHRQLSFSSWIERAWNSLGGPACVDAVGYENAQAYFSMLEDVSLDGIDAAGEAMKERLAGLFAKSDPSVSDRCGVQLMTMHKAKGLGFNVVILPGLNKPVGRGSFNLLQYVERSNGIEPETLIAPIGSKGEKASRVNQWVDRQRQNREAEERKRLFYVACTRAREELHLFASVVETKKERGARSGSLLETAWPALKDCFDLKDERLDPPTHPGNALEFPPELLDEELSSEVLYTVAAASNATSLSRLPSNWAPIPTNQNVTWATEMSDAAFTQVEDHLRRPHGSYSSRILGTTVHALFERAARILQIDRSEVGLRKMMDEFRLQANTLTRNSGLPPQEAVSVAKSALQAVEKMLNDSIGLWVLGSHRKSQTESSWTGMIEGVPRTLRIDRSFFAGPAPLLDDESCLWIIDYKTASHGASGIENFLEAEKLQYAAQLASYAEILRLIHGRETQLRVGLYYPFLARLIWWAV